MAHQPRTIPSEWVRSEAREPTLAALRCDAPSREREAVASWVAALLPRETTLVVAALLPRERTLVVTLSLDKDVARLPREKVGRKGSRTKRVADEKRRGRKGSGRKGSRTKRVGAKRVADENCLSPLGTLP